MNRFSSFNPFFRKNLLDSVRDAFLIDVCLFFSKNRFSKVKEEVNLDLLVKMAKHVSFHFSNKISLRFTGSKICEVELREISLERPLIFHKDQLCDEDIERELKHTSGKTFSISIFDLILREQNWHSSKLRLKACYLLSETAVFRDRHGVSSWFNELGIRGINFHFSEVDINVFIGNKHIRNYVNMYFVNTSQDLSRSDTFYNLGTTYTGITGQTFFIPDVKLPVEILIEKEHHLIAHVLKNPLDFINYNEFISYTKNIIDIYANDYSSLHIKFLSKLLNEINSLEYGIADLRFAILSNGSIKILKPIDIVLKLEENSFFINQLIDFYSQRCP